MVVVVFIAASLFALCVLQCALLFLAWLERRESREDYRKIINEWSIRTGGRIVYKPPANNDKVGEPEPSPDRGEFQIITPSMAEEEAFDLEHGNGEMSQDDLEHLQRTGVLPK